MDPNADCLNCHGVAQAAGSEGEPGLALPVAALDYRDSVHGGMDCVDCHRSGYRRYPHRRTRTLDRPSCVDCHGADQGLPIMAIAEELGSSVHVAGIGRSGAIKAKGRTPLDCSACHDAHAFRPARVGDPITGIARGHNQVCLSCHGDQGDALELRHDWLPSPSAHWRSARCIDCHTAAAGVGGHQPHRILPADQGQRDCVGCHSANGTLLGRLYAYRAAQGSGEDGWLSRAVRNEAYLVGMSRNTVLDRTGVSALALVLLATLAHGLGRWWIRVRPRAEPRGGRQ